MFQVCSLSKFTESYKIYIKDMSNRKKKDGMKKLVIC